jgi:CheY-like chemotaxis protein
MGPSVGGFLALNQTSTGLLVDNAASSRANFDKHLRYALRHLYDPIALGHSPLPRIFSLSAEDEPLEVLRRVLVDAIETLRPDPDTPSQAPAWRVYRILSERYVEQFSQDVVAAHLAVGTRQLRRQEQHALQALADFLWAHYDLHLSPPIYSQQPCRARGEVELNGDAEPSRDQELNWLRAKYPREPVSIEDIIRPELKTIRPLLLELGVQVECGPLESLPTVMVQPTGLRRALSAIFTVALHTGVSGTLHIGARAKEQNIEIEMAMISLCCPVHGLTQDDIDNLNLAREIIGFSEGNLQVISGYRDSETFRVKLCLPVTTRTTVMVIDDNTDTLQLFERYLVHTTYHYIGCANPEQAISLAEEVAPQIIVLDVMLPGIDGWELLGRLREHPKLRGVPIIVCTILAQEQLASVLGAAAFIRKPVSQSAFTAALDQQVALRVTISGKGH